MPPKALTFYFRNVVFSFCHILFCSLTPSTTNNHTNKQRSPQTFRVHCAMLAPTQRLSELLSRIISTCFVLLSSYNTYQVFFFFFFEKGEEKK